MFVKRSSSTSAVSCDRVGSSAVYKPSRTARRIDASRRCLSAAMVNPHHGMRVKHTAAWRVRRPCRCASTSRRSCRGSAAVSGRAGLRALANDVTDVLAGRQMIRNGDAKYLYGGQTSNVRYLWRQTFSVLALGVT